MISKTTTVRKTSGLILWKNSINTNLEKTGADTLITLIVNKQEIEANDKQIKKDVIKISADELERIQNDPDLQHLVQQ
ncbi:hypothetical protein [Chryseobacterium gregarium]|uniref:hypothetical protein n=1 Tax=Chryseobacterium gregarium TaxID=456299 RepID=UPI000402E174|nr:hypothetical protein [Chryseobacterium gregarium]